MKILLYAPEKHGYACLQRMFEQHGVQTDIVLGSDQCRFLSMTTSYTAVVMANPSSFPDLEAFFSAWKSDGCTSLFMVITRRQSAYERAKALELGVDRYYIEPYSYSKLVSDITVHEYRKHLKDRTSLKTESFEVDVLARTVFLDGQPLPLTRTEFELLALLIRKRGTVLSRVQIWEAVWGNREYPLANTIDVHMNRLRRKLEGKGCTLIRTVHGIGYRLHEEA